MKIIVSVASRVSLIAAAALATAFPAAASEKDSLATALHHVSELRRPVVLAALAQSYQSTHPDTAVALAREGLELSRRFGQAENTALCLHRLGMAHRFKGEYQTAHAFCTESLRLSRVLKNEKLVADNLNAIGIAYAGLGLFSKALDCYLQALTLREKLNDVRGVAASLSNIGAVQTQQGNYEKAHECYEQALRELEALPDTDQAVAFTLEEMASLYKKQGKLGEALSIYRDIQHTFFRLKEYTGIQACLTNIADIHLHQGNTAVALDCYGKGLDLARRMGVKEAAARCLLGLARVRMAEGNLEECLTEANRALALATEAGLQLAAKEANLLLYGIYKSLRNHEKALLHLETANSVEDSVHHADQASVSFAVQSRHDWEKKHAHVASLHHGASQKLTRYAQQKYWLTGALAVLAALVYLAIRNVRQERKIGELLLKQRMSELAHLNAHKIRGPVASILGLVSLYNRINTNDKFNAVVIDHIDTSARQLDLMIHEVADKTNRLYEMHEG